MRFLFDAAAAFMMLGLVEAVVKPIARRYMRRKIIAYAPNVLKVLDQKLPQLLADGATGADVEAYVRRQLEALTGESWADADVGPIFELFDPRALADHQP